MTHLILSRPKKMNRAYWSMVGLLLALMLLTAWIGLHTFAYLNLENQNLPEKTRELARSRVFVFFKILRLFCSS